MPFFSRILFAVIVFLGSFGVPQAAAAQAIDEAQYYWIEEAATRLTDLPLGYSLTRAGWEGGFFGYEFQAGEIFRQRGPLLVMGSILGTQDMICWRALPMDCPIDVSRADTPGECCTVIMISFYAHGFHGSVIIFGIKEVTYSTQAVALMDRIVARLGGDTRNRGPAFEFVR